MKLARLSLMQQLAWPVSAWFFSALLVVGGILFGATKLDHNNNHEPFINFFCRFDGGHYAEIVERGYSYEPAAPSTVAFFPAFPMIGRLVSIVADTSAKTALVLVSNAFLCASFIMFHYYMLLRQGEVRSGSTKTLVRHCGISQLANKYALCAFALLPSTFFFRMAYSEAVFIFFAMLSLYAMERRWSMVSTAVIVGMATACRPVGVAVAFVFAIYCLRRVTDDCREKGTSACLRAAARLAGLIVLSLWGLGSFAAFQYVTFGDPAAFVKTQTFWQCRPDGPVGDKILALLSSQPIWEMYHPASPRHWSIWDPPIPLFNLAFWNPIYFVGMVMVILIGYRLHWINHKEFVLSFCLLAIPYVTKGYEFCMASHARFAAAAFPAYIVFGHVFAAMPLSLVVIALSIFAFFLSAYAAMFAANYAFF